jgi:hypothetical protein
MFARSENYFADAEGAKELALGSNHHDLTGQAWTDVPGQSDHTGTRENSVASSKRNPRSWWVIGPEPLKAKHYAAFPTELAAKCLRAAVSVKGCCPACGAAWARVVERTFVGSYHDHAADGIEFGLAQHGGRPRALDGRPSEDDAPPYEPARTLGWRATCEHQDLSPVPCRVLDPFAGSGRTLIAAARLGCEAVGIELNPEYVTMAREEIARALRPQTARTTKPIPAPLFAQPEEPVDLF